MSESHRMTLCAVLAACPHNEKSRLVERILTHYKIPVVVYSPQWMGLLSKISIALQASRDLTDVTHILFLDAYDVVALAGPDEILERFQTFDHPWVCNADPHIWPPQSFTADEYPPCDTPWRFLNSGAYLADREYLRDCLERWGVPEQWPSQNDQDWFAEKYVHEPGCITLDTHCELFQCLIGGWWAFEVSPGRLYNTVTQTTPLILHHNGGGRLDEERMLPFYEHLI